jgi:hypothetical protein
MSGTAWFHLAFGALVVVILLMVWVAIVLEAGPDPPVRQETAEPGEMAAPERKAHERGPRAGS